MTTIQHPTAPVQGGPSKDRPDRAQLLAYLPHTKQALKEFLALLAGIEGNNPEVVVNSRHYLQRCGFRIEMIEPTRQWGAQP